MSDKQPSPSEGNNEADNNVSKASQGAKDGFVLQRRTLMIGAVTASAVISIKPALAQTAGSILNCEIPVPGNHAAGSYIAADGSTVSSDTPGAYPPALRNFTGEEVKQAINGRSLPGTSPDQSQAYVNYIRKLQAGQSGFTCYASLLTPR